MRFLVSLIVLFGTFSVAEIKNSCDNADAASSDTCVRLKTDRVIWSPEVVMPQQVLPGFVHVHNGILLRVKAGSQDDANAYANAQGVELEVEEFVMSPGLVDTHVHLSPLNRTWEGFTSGTMAAVAGGVTTVVLMPLNSLPPTTSIRALNLELQAASVASLYADVGFWAGVVPGNIDSLTELLDAGVLGIKAFLSPLPASAGFEAVSPDDLQRAAPKIARAGLPLLVHAELMTIEESDKLIQAEGGTTKSFSTFLKTRPREFEQRAHRALVRILDSEPRLHVHIVHLSDATHLGYLSAQQARFGKNRLTVETCPHYLVFAAETIPDGDTRFKCFPPIREGWNRDLLLEGLLNGTVSTIASDHSPCETSMRQLASGDFFKAWAGLSALQTSLPATWAALQPAMPRTNALRNLAKWWSEEPSALAGLSQKGKIAEGFDADLVFWDPDDLAVNERLFHRHAGSAYAGKLHPGRVHRTLVRGVDVFVEGTHGRANGQILLRGEQEKRPLKT